MNFAVEEFEPDTVGLPFGHRIPDPPPGLWVRGSQQALAMPCVAVVGARACSPYGRTVARLIGRQLAERGYCVVSGLARGVDCEAHRGALDGGGRTVAVMATGVDRIYPSAHGELAREILNGGGALVSEFELGTEPAPWRFPARNRIIAGLSQALIVVEARDVSGALIAADFAMEAGVPVFAVPGEITCATSRGSNRLLTQGARPFLDIECMKGVVEG